MIDTVVAMDSYLATYLQHNKEVHIALIFH